MLIPLLFFTVILKSVLMKSYREPDYEDVYQDAGTKNAFIFICHVKDTCSGSIYFNFIQIQFPMCCTFV